MTSNNLFEKPHSLSYHDSILQKLSLMTLTSDKSIIESKKVANQHKLVNIMFSDGEITVRNQNDK